MVLIVLNGRIRAYEAFLSLQFTQPLCTHVGVSPDKTSSQHGVVMYTHDWHLPDLFYVPVRACVMSFITEVWCEHLAGSNLSTRLIISKSRHLRGRAEALKSDLACCARCCQPILGRLSHPLEPRIFAMMQDLKHWHLGWEIRVSPTELDCSAWFRSFLNPRRKRWTFDLKVVQEERQQL